MDLEMTGLEPARHVIVEIATLITDDDLTIIAEGPDLVLGATPEQLAEMGDFVTAMHTKSGLLDEIKRSTVTVADAQRQTLDFLKSHISEARSVPLCGNSIGTDRRFLQEYMPELEAFVHYRNVDVSTIKELARRWHPEARPPPKYARRFRIPPGAWHIRRCPAHASHSCSPPAAPPPGRSSPPAPSCACGSPAAADVPRARAPR